MPQGKGTYGDQVGRPSKKRSAFKMKGWSPFTYHKPGHKETSPHIPRDYPIDPDDMGGGIDPYNEGTTTLGAGAAGKKFGEMIADQTPNLGMGKAGAKWAAQQVARQTPNLHELQHGKFKRTARKLQMKKNKEIIPQTVRPPKQITPQTVKDRRADKWTKITKGMRGKYFLGGGEGAAEGLGQVASNVIAKQVPNIGKLKKSKKKKK